MLRHQLTWALGAALILAGAAAGEQTTEAPQGRPDQAALEARFQRELSGAVLSGHFTETGKAAVDPETGLKEEQYTISSLRKLSGDRWLFQARIKYGDHDVTLPLPLRVQWAGDTPVITVDRMPVPGLGTFTARVMIYDQLYAGTWSGGDHGGHLFGRIVRQPPADP